MRLVDLRSDTVTRPTDGMRKAMAEAEVGDDVYREDPTINTLQERAAEMLGFQAGLFTPSGSMANAIWQLTLARPGTEVLCEADAHIVNYEAGAGALWAGVQYRTVPAERGLLTLEQVVANVRPDSFPATPTTLVSLEQTHNRHGGSVYPMSQLAAIAGAVHDAGIPVHVDGARVWNAVVASADDASTYGSTVDGMNFCFSKALGAPVGSVMVGAADAIEQARSWRRRLGGGMRQAGVLAAAALYALDHHIDRLADDHANARLMAQILADAVPDRVDVAAVETNMVYVDLGAVSLPEVLGALSEEDVLVGAMGPTTLRLVTHLDVDTEGCRRAAELLARILTGRR